MKYSGSCQCGAVTFDVDTTIEKVMSCNCSRCRRLGALLAFAPKTGAPTVAVNVRCLEGVDPDSFEVMKFDGAKL